LKLGDFGTFVIFTAIYAAGTLGVPQISFLAYQIKIGEIPTAFVAIFGMPAVFGLTLGQFIANLGFEASPIASLSPVFSFVGLLVVYYLRKASTLAGCIAYIVITSIWLTFLLPLASNIPVSEAAYSAFGGQFIAVIVGYVLYLAAKKTMTEPTQTASPTSS
jgi:uncharacterized membrane protein